ncbi:MAG: amidoligase family protein [Geminicoccaceae bacterium]|nr:amidoligase family protein [Geminicoccaceae bacterium]
MRRVGVEIEFAGVEVDDAADLVRQHFGGQTKTLDVHRTRVEGTRIGDFIVELDSMYAHPDTDSALLGKLKGKMKDRVTGAVGDVVGLWLPNEIIAPPIPYDQLPELDRLIDRLRDRGAEGTGASVFYGFGLQLNPEVSRRDAGYLLRHLQAYLILSPWLREEIEIDLTRRLLPFADPFPDEYVRTVLAADYAPPLHRLIRDYIEHNPSRNRELDLMPLFMELAPEVTGELVDDPHIKARPTFHYRLPNARLDDPNWGGVALEWNRWVEVERLAADRERLEEARAEVHEHLEREADRGWLDWLRAWRR